jgi:hypothetical protein
MMMTTPKTTTTTMTKAIAIAKLRPEIGNSTFICTIAEVDPQALFFVATYGYHNTVEAIPFDENGEFLARGFLSAFNYTKNRSEFNFMFPHEVKLTHYRAFLLGQNAILDTDDSPYRSPFNDGSEIKVTITRDSFTYELPEIQWETTQS